MHKTKLSSGRKYYNKEEKKRWNDKDRKISEQNSGVEKQTEGKVAKSS